MPSRIRPAAAGILLVLCAAPAAPLASTQTAPSGAAAAPPQTAPSSPAGTAARPELPAGTLLVVNKSADTLAFVDSARLQVIATVPTGHAPHEVAVDAAGAMAYVSNYGTQERPGSTLTVVDIAARRAVATIDLAPLQRPHGILIAPDGTVLVTYEGSQAVAAVDPASRRAAATIPTGQQVTHMLAITPDGSRLYSANIGSDTVTRMDLALREVTHIPVGKGPEGIDVSPDGREVWVAHRGDGGLSILDEAAGRVKETIPSVCEMPIRVKFTPQGGLALVSCAKSNDVTVLASAGMKARTVALRIPTGEMPVGVLVLPDGSHAFVANTLADRVSVLDMQSGKVVATFSPGDEPDGMAWVPARPAAAAPASPSR
jgi:YVTN family beta-propeller protein